MTFWIVLFGMVAMAHIGGMMTFWICYGMVFLVFTFLIWPRIDRTGDLYLAYLYVVCPAFLVVGIVFNIAWKLA